MGREHENRPRGRIHETQRGTIVLSPIIVFIFLITLFFLLVTILIILVLVCTVIFTGISQQATVRRPRQRFDQGVLAAQISESRSIGSVPNAHRAIPARGGKATIERPGHRAHLMVVGKGAKKGPSWFVRHAPLLLAASSDRKGSGAILAGGMKGCQADEPGEHFQG
jgi:hypothetical protein